MSHYFENDPTLSSKPRDVTFRIDGRPFSLVSDIGVFSKNELDYGTYVLLNYVVKQPSSKKVLDVGCGYGPIGICIASFWPLATVDCIDVNARAVELTQGNIQKMQLPQMRAWLSDGFISVTDNYSTIVMNPPVRAGKKVIYRLFADSYAHLEPGGVLYLVMRKDQGAESAMTYLGQWFQDVQRVFREKGYYIIRAMKTNS